MERQLASLHRLLPFTGVTQLHRYYEPLRHPSQPGLSLTSCQLIHTAITAGTSRVATGPLCLHAFANTPAGPMETCSLVQCHRLRPSPNRRRVGPCITLFEACSAFTHVTACMLTESPMRPSTPKASAASLPPLLLRLLTGWNEPAPGRDFSPAEDQRLFTAHSDLGVIQALGLQLSGFYFLRSEIGQQFLRSRVGKSAQEEGRSRTKCLCAFSELG